jgi:hypothetical protein
VLLVLGLRILYTGGCSETNRVSEQTQFVGITGVAAMLRTWSFGLLLFFMVLVLPLAAQEAEDPVPPLESEWEDYASNLYSRGDKTFIITLGVVIPTVFTGAAIDEKGHGLNVGGTGFLAYNYFLSSGFYLGGEFGGMFAGTRGENMLFIIPFGVRFGYQFVAGRFEFPVTFMIGAAAQKYLENNYIGLFLKPGAAVYWRFNPDWSFGLNANWWIVPQWPKNGENATGNFVEATLSARYHF